VETARGRHTQPVLRNQPAAAAPGSRRHHPQAQPSWLPADLLGVAFLSTGAPPVDLERRSVEIERDRWVSSNKRAKERGTGKGKGEHRGKIWMDDGSSARRVRPPAGWMTRGRALHHTAAGIKCVPTVPDGSASKESWLGSTSRRLRPRQSRVQYETPPTPPTDRCLSLDQLHTAAAASMDEPAASSSLMEDSRALESMLLVVVFEKTNNNTC